MRNFNWSKGGNLEGKEGYFLTFGYDSEIIKNLKETIPAHLREWQPEKVRWWVSAYCEKQINDIFPGFLEAVVAQRRLF